MRYGERGTILAAAAALLALGPGAGQPSGWIEHDRKDGPRIEANGEPVELDASMIRIEINDTDGDAGIQVFLDGEGWDRMQVTDPTGRKILDFRGKGSVGQQGITELFFESAEPSFDEQPLEELLEMFPEGEYLFSGRTTEGERLLGEARLTHALPEGPVQLYPVDGETVDPGDLTLQWELVADPAGSAIVGYEVVVSREAAPVRTFKVDLPSTATSVTVPAEYLEAEAEYKWEVLAIERSGNQTLSENEFETED